MIWRSKSEPTFGLSFNDFAKHAVAILVGADNLELVLSARLQVEDLDPSRVRRIDLELVPVGELCVFLPMPSVTRVRIKTCEIGPLEIAARITLFCSFAGTTCNRCSPASTRW